MKRIKPFFRLLSIILTDDVELITIRVEVVVLGRIDKGNLLKMKSKEHQMSVEGASELCSDSALIVSS